MNVYDNIRRRARGTVPSLPYMREHVIGLGPRRTRDEVLRSSSSTVSTEQILADLDEDRGR